MVDLHSHILPGLDDGPGSMEEAVLMARRAAASNVSHIAATSHGNYYPYALEEYQEKFTELEEVLRGQNIPVKLYPGMEIFVDENTAGLLEKGRLLTLNGTDYILAEFPFDQSGENVCRQLRKLRDAGYRIVVAHPERYMFIQKETELAYYLESQGYVLQVNQGSLEGDFGRACKMTAEQLLVSGIARVIATDAHDTIYRSHDLQQLMWYLSGMFTSAEIRLWLSENPSRILKGSSTIGLNTDRKEE